MAQFKRVWLPYKNDMNTFNTSRNLNSTFYPIDDESTETANTEIQNLITQGWRIVSTAPLTGSCNIWDPEGDDVYATFTTGIEVFMVKE